MGTVSELTPLKTLFVIRSAKDAAVSVLGLHKSDAPEIERAFEQAWNELSILDREILGRDACNIAEYAYQLSVIRDRNIDELPDEAMHVLDRLICHAYS